MEIGELMREFVVFLGDLVHAVIYYYKPKKKVKNEEHPDV
jgi:hypothetical protein